MIRARAAEPPRFHRPTLELCTVFSDQTRLPLHGAPRGDMTATTTGVKPKRAQRKELEFAGIRKLLKALLIVTSLAFVDFAEQASGLGVLSAPLPPGWESCVMSFSSEYKLEDHKAGHGRR